MSEFALSIHARKRMQQRAIPPLVLDMLFDCGSVSRCGGADRLTFDRAAIRRLQHQVGGEKGLKQFERWLSVYAIVGDNGEVVTAAHRTRRFRR